MYERSHPDASSGQKAQQPPKITSLADVVEQIDQDGDGEHVPVNEIVSAFGSRSFGPLILAPAILVASPLSGIPGFSSVAAVVIALVAAQLLIGRSSPWLPRFLTKRELNRDLLGRSAGFLRKVARYVDRLVAPRLQWLTTGIGARVIAAICLLIALSMPPLEIVPMANSMTGAVISVFGLALVSHDGVLALIGGALLAIVVAIIGGALLAA